jgi:23S rRNA pseudouridine1911/1915/1917 synthase
VPHPAARRLIVEPADAGQRLDRYLAQALPDLSRSRVQALLEAGDVTLRGRHARTAEKVRAGDKVVVRVPAPAPVGLVPEAIPLDVIYEDGDLLVVNKPAGLVVHPAPGHSSGTLVHALLAHVPGLARHQPGGGTGERVGTGPPPLADGAEFRPGIVHRLDKETSGLMVVAKHEQAQRFLAAQLKHREMDKRYLALVDGGPAADSGTIDAPIGRDPRRPRQMAVVPGGRPAVTHFRVLRRFHRHSLLECKPVTGRTHQIRVHLAAIGSPVTADATYGRRPPSLPLSRHFLHAARLTLHLPSGDRRTFEAPLPAELRAALDQLEGRSLSPPTR